MNFKSVRLGRPMTTGLLTALACVATANPVMSQTVKGILDGTLYDGSNSPPRFEVLVASPARTITITIPFPNGNPAASATASFSSDYGYVKVTAEKARQQQGVAHTSVARGVLLEVLTLSIPGASASTRTSIPVTFTYSGGSTNGGYSMSELNVGGDPASFCGFCSDAGVATARRLPKPVNVISAPDVGILPNDLRTYTTTPKIIAGTLIVQGSRATVPLFLGALADTTSWYYLDNKARLVVSYNLTLPRGVTCKSRSGRALNGLCPL